MAVVMGGMGDHRWRSSSTSRLVDPEGSFLGPSYIRLPLLLLGALLLDLLPRTLWLLRAQPEGDARASSGTGCARTGPGSGWTLVALGIICFYVVYVSYRNLKSFLPFVIDDEVRPRAAPARPRAALRPRPGDDPAHRARRPASPRTSLSYVYLWFLPMVPLVVTAWLVWSRNLSYGYWFVTSQCLAWTLGTISYYALPTLGPGFEYVWLYTGAAEHPGRAS